MSEQITENQFKIICEAFKPFIDAANSNNKENVKWLQNKIDKLEEINKLLKKELSGIHRRIDNVKNSLSS